MMHHSTHKDTRNTTVQSSTLYLCRVKSCESRTTRKKIFTPFGGVYTVQKVNILFRIKKNTTPIELSPNFGAPWSPFLRCFTTPWQENTIFRNVNTPMGNKNIPDGCHYITVETTVGVFKSPWVHLNSIWGVFISALGVFWSYPFLVNAVEWVFYNTPHFATV